jgi:predicted kinase
MPTLYMMVGVPLSGKSTWIQNSDIVSKTTVVVSTDNTIETIAKALNETYNSIFKNTTKLAEYVLQRDCQNAIANDYDIIWDQTNLTKKSRAGKIQSIPNYYRKVAVVFPHPAPSVMLERNKKRSAQGKHIPEHIISSMIETYERPSLDEGFDVIIDVVERS